MGAKGFSLSPKAISCNAVITMAPAARIVVSVGTPINP